MLEKKTQAPAAQGTIEYLIIIAIVIVIALVVVATLTGFLSNEELNENANNISFLSQEIAITESIQTTGGYLSLNLKSNTPDNITITNITTNNENSTFNTNLSPQETKNLIIKTNTCTQNQKTQNTITINYTTPQGLTKKITYPTKLTTQCTNQNITQTITTNYTLSTTGIKNGLTAYYPFDTNAGDYSGNENNATNHGATLTTGKINGAYAFDGDEDYIERSLTLTSGSTIAFWAKPNIEHSNCFIFAHTSTTEQWAFRLWSDDRMWFQSTTGNTVTINVPNLNTDAWNYVVLSINTNGVMTLFLDGENKNTAQMNGDITTNTIGDYTFASGFGFNGTLDEVAVWNRALSEEEILLLYNNGNGRSLIQ